MKTKGTRNGAREPYELWKLRYKRAEEELLNLIPYGTLLEVQRAKNKLYDIRKGCADYLEKYKEEKYYGNKA